MSTCRQQRSLAGLSRGL